jgi:hypothetical protein
MYSLNVCQPIEDELVLAIRVHRFPYSSKISISDQRKISLHEGRVLGCRTVVHQDIFVFLSIFA